MRVFLPGLVGFLGDQGSGKSFAAIKLACNVAENIGYDLCFNFDINLKELYNYCSVMGYTHLQSRILHNNIRIKSSKDLIQFMDTGKTIYVLDEAGVYLNSRRFQEIDTEFLHDLAQIRHDCKHLYWISQYYDMVDKILRSLTQGFVQCGSDTRYNKKLGNFELYKQRIYTYSARNYKIYLSRVHEKFQGLKYWVNARKLAQYSFEGKLSLEDKQIFNIYQSFNYRVGDENKEQQYFFNKSKQVSYTEKEFDSIESGIKIDMSKSSKPTDNISQEEWQTLFN